MGRVMVSEAARTAAGLELEVLSTAQIASVFGSDSTSTQEVPFAGGWNVNDYKRIAVSMRGSVTIEPYYSASTSGGFGIGVSSGDYKEGWFSKWVKKGEKKTAAFIDEETLVVSLPYGRTLSANIGREISVKWHFPAPFPGASLSAKADTSGIATNVNDSGNGIGAYYRGSISNLSIVFTLYGIKE